MNEFSSNKNGDALRFNGGGFIALFPENETHYASVSIFDQDGHSITLSAESALDVFGFIGKSLTYLAEQAGEQINMEAGEDEGNGNNGDAGDVSSSDIVTDGVTHSAAIDTVEGVAND